MKGIIQIKVSLQDTKPLIWRRILVNTETSFFELHHIIQIAMGWKNYHLFEFNLDGYRVGMVNENDYEEGGNELLDSTRTLLTDILSLENDSFNYNYDFGDGWLHEIILEQLVEKKEKIIYPICVDGHLACPPEDCGGIGGFYNMLKILQDKKHPEYRETKAWVGRKYDPEDFDPEKANKQLNHLQKYIARWNSPD